MNISVPLLVLFGRLDEIARVRRRARATELLVIEIQAATRNRYINQRNSFEPNLSRIKLKDRKKNHG
jgi:hypothetical protein